MIEYPLSPINLGGFSILSFAVDFDAAAQGQVVTADRNVTVGFNVDTLQQKLENGVSRCSCILSLECDIFEVAGENEAGAHLGTVKVKFSGVASGRFSEDESEEAIRDTLEANAASFLYGKARTYIELITASCPGGTISLPAIMPIQKDLEE